MLVSAALLLGLACPDSSRAVPVGQASLFVESCGTGSPVVLIHGGNTDRRMWNEQFDAWSRAFRVIRYDVRGFGRSTRPDERYWSHEDLAVVLDSLGLRSATIVGLSLGGRIALDFALTHPDRAQALVLVAPGMSGFPWTRDRDSSWVKIRAALKRGDSTAAARWWLRTPYLKPAMERPELRAWLEQLAVENAPSWVLPDPEPELEPGAYLRLREIRAPTLVVVGSRDIRDIQRIVDRLATGLPHVTRVTIPGSGHLVNIERPRELDRAVLPFLERYAR